MARDLEFTIIICEFCGSKFLSLKRSQSQIARFCSTACVNKACKTYVQTPADVRFWRHVKKTTECPVPGIPGGGCWLWTASRALNGYGNFALGPFDRTSPCVMTRAHKFSWQLH